MNHLYPDLLTVLSPVLPVLWIVLAAIGVAGAAFGVYVMVKDKKWGDPLEDGVVLLLKALALVAISITLLAMSL